MTDPAAQAEEAWQKYCNDPEGRIKLIENEDPLRYELLEWTYKVAYLRGVEDTLLQQNALLQQGAGE